ncbi:glutamate receptor -like [Olea europaea subsp. europaea]|uniref:Glutamate receptor -like n=1 Tax=Olea europaea subsp. europaea TaxID=158383 RepID=A0A8S0PF29_OLEEU|nr:glutamate receptor -like [Olea europaea subsp. europaea]
MFTGNRLSVVVPAQSSPNDTVIDGIELQSKTSQDAQPSTVGRSKTSIHVTALDGIVNVNSLFTMAIFIGFSLTVPANGSAGHPASCNASIDTVRRLIVFEVISFSFFLFSSLIAQSLKLTINLLNSLDASDPHKADIDSSVLKYGLFGSATGSVMGCLFLTLSIVDFIQVKLGVLSCGGEPVYGVVTLVVFVGSSLLVYIFTSVYASFFM